MDFVGLVNAVGFAEKGHQVFALDSDKKKIAAFRRNEVFRNEYKLEDILAKNDVNIRFTSEYRDAIYDSNGYSETVTDEEILDAQKLLARTEGIGVEPASAASIAGLKKLVDEGVVDEGETITCVVTGHLLKDPNTAIEACTKPTQVDADIDTLRKILMNK